MINWSQVLFNSIVTGSLYALFAVGLTLIYGLSKVPNFAHAEFMALGAYVGYATAEQLSLGSQTAFLTAFTASGILGAFSYVLVFRPLIHRGSSIVHLMVASIGLGFIVRHSLQEVWGGAPLTFRIFWASYEIGPLMTTGLWIYIIIAAVSMSAVMHTVLTRTKIGKAMRAASSNPELALASGIDVDKVALLGWSIGAALAGIGGLFRALDTRIVPMIGWEMLIPTFAATILGGIGSFYGALVAAYLIGLAENLGLVALSAVGLSTEYRPAIAFIILILTLILKPAGLGKLFRGG